MQVLESVKTNIAFSPLLKRYSLQEFWELPEPDDRSHYELIEGVLYIVPPPSNPHGKVIASLTQSLIVYNYTKSIAGTVYHPREAIYIEDIWGTYLEPDMMFVSAELEERMGGRRTSAEIVFECLSESTGVYDRTTKADTYLALGVNELWLIDSDKETVEIRNADAQDGILFWRKRLYAKGEAAESQILEDWKISVSEIFSVQNIK